MAADRRTSPSRAGGRLRRAAAVGWALTAWGAPAAAQEPAVPVPVALQIRLLSRVVRFDRNLRAASVGGPVLVLGVVYQSRNRSSADIWEAVRQTVASLGSEGFGGRPVRVVPIDLDGSRSLDEVVVAEAVRILYVAPLRKVGAAEIAVITRRHRVTSVTGVPRYVETDLAIGVDLKAERPEIVVNLAAAREEGVDLGAELLKLARIVDRGKE